MIKNILFATDGSPASVHAASYVASIAQKYDAKVLVIHAFHTLPDHLGEPNYSQAMYKTLEDASKVTETAVNTLMALGVKEVDSEYIEGPPVDVILNVINVRRPDLMIIGSRGLGTWKGAIMGSVSAALTQRCECPVLVVK
jgi:nucleotide-binding universal stress UspA family protein